LPDTKPKDHPLAIIAGPCVIESEANCLLIAEQLYKVAKATGVLPIFKASFDKANRTSVDSYRGPGMQEGLRILEKVRREVGLPVLTDIHLPDQAKPVAQVVDILQIPAFLCRQTDLLVAAGETGKPINVKKGQFLVAEDMQHVARKLESTGNKKLMFTERGSSFGRRDLVVDMRSLVELARLGYPVIFDATHSVQQIGGAGGKSGGHPEFIFPLARAAVATGAVSAVFLETHPEPSAALSDGANMLPLDLLEEFVEEMIRVADALGASKPASSIGKDIAQP
jgi:2-dehydro-3-deoxyphosphooctonate aldolase (KDO 8-P synthase)